MSDLPLLHKGSVKDIYGVLNQSPYVFKYSDRYSVFDWGEMPDALDGKGQALATMAKLFFDVLGDNKNWKSWEPSISLNEELLGTLATLKSDGVKHHGIDLVDERSFSVEPMNVINPAYMESKRCYDYSQYHGDLIDTLVPLEVIFRFDISNGSSLLKRAGNTSYLDSMGLQCPPKPGDHYDLPLVEFSTKLESTDRYLPISDAQVISSMTDYEISELKNITVLLSLRLQDIFKEIGVSLHDGKFEFAFTKDRNGQRTFQLIDSIGPDELRISARGKQLSKERLREFYRDGDWHKKIEEAKEIAILRGTPDWKSICHEEFNLTPPQIQSDKLEAVAMMYKTLTNELSKKYFNKKIFENAWSMKELINRLP
ncbi:MAG: hypothetical protein HN576_00705 [Bacteriovoracaceae bacterium]|jgi:phosphoribosylaminoimidazole-succinocarboxamide synthase|nr:hypothetical protein [Bacteriovoracaceae bacterium]